MKRLFVLAIAFGLVGSLSAKNKDGVEQNEVFKNSYTVDLRLDMPGIKEVAVINTLVDFDPLAVFKNYVLKQEKAKKTWDKKFAESYRKHNIPLYIVATGQWDDSIFAKVKANDVYMLEQKKFKIAQGLAGHMKNQKMWLVTKSTRLDETPLAWVIPLDLTEGFKGNTEIVLNKENAINLVDLYKQIVAEAAKK